MEIHGRTDAQLAAYLDLSATDVALLAAERVHSELEIVRAGLGNQGHPGLPIPDVFALDLMAERYGADTTRLVKVILSVL